MVDEIKAGAVSDRMARVHSLFIATCMLAEKLMRELITNNTINTWKSMLNLLGRV